MFTLEVWSDASEDAVIVAVCTTPYAGSARMLANAYKADGRFVVLADADSIRVA